MLGCLIANAQDPSHSDTVSPSKFSQLLKDQIRFSAESHRELFPNSEEPSLTVHRETGKIALENGEWLDAVWVYRGNRGKPQGDFELFAVTAGKAKTFSAATKACEKLVPLGEWRLVNVVHVMAFFSELLPAHAMFDQPQFKGRFFWANSLNEKQDKKNKDDFVASNTGGGEAIQVLSFKKFIQWVHISENKSQTTDEKRYYQELKKKVEDGIPVLCIRGKEPEGK